MSRAPWPSAFGRGQAPPLQIDVPQRLPGGLWGPPPATGIVSYDNQGNPAGGFGTVPASARGMARAEWPIPVRWEIQVGLSLQCVAGAGGSFEFSPGDFRLFWQLQSYTESASASQELVLEYGAGIYPAVQNWKFSEVKPSTYVLTAQRIEMQVLYIEDNGIGSSQIHDTSWRWSVSFMPALTASGWPA